MTFMIVAALLMGQGQIKADPEHFPLSLHRSMELDDLDREIHRQHDLVLVKQAELVTTRKLARKGAVSAMDLERDESDARYQEAREKEMVAYRALKQYEHDVMTRKSSADDARGYALLLDLLEKQEVMAQIELDYRTFILKRVQMLKDRKAVSREEEEVAEFDFNSSRAAVALSKARQAQVELELAMRSGEKRYDRAKQFELKANYQCARVSYTEVVVAGARSRLERAKIGCAPEA